MSDEIEPNVGTPVHRTTSTTSTSTGSASAEQLTRIERVVWATPLAAEIEPWTTPGRVTVVAMDMHGTGSQ
ncbi:MAG: hypothetical protein ACR2JY_01865 [Chloroflexota bacterium]